MKKAPSITAFFPCYNDAGTIGSLVVLVEEVLKKITDDYEILVIDDGSQDHSLDVLNALKKDHPRLRVIEHVVNRGYGGALRSGFEHATKELVFYTDGDAQYDVTELEDLYREWIKTNADVVNGYKLKRNDPWYRIVIGKIYQRLMKIMFGLSIIDVDCDFRLIRRSVFDTVKLEHNSGVICVEMMTKIEAAGFRVAEVPVHHFFRTYGKSQIMNVRRIVRILVALVQLWIRLILLREAKPGLRKKQ